MSNFYPQNAMISLYSGDCTLIVNGSVSGSFLTRGAEKVSKYLQIANHYDKQKVNKPL